MNAKWHLADGKTWLVGLSVLGLCSMLASAQDWKAFEFLEPQHLEHKGIRKSPLPAGARILNARSIRMFTLPVDDPRVVVNEGVTNFVEIIWTGITQGKTYTIEWGPPSGPFWPEPTLGDWWGGPGTSWGNSRGPQSVMVTPSCIFGWACPDGASFSYSDCDDEANCTFCLVKAFNGRSQEFFRLREE